MSSSTVGALPSSDRRAGGLDVGDERGAGGVGRRDPGVDEPAHEVEAGDVDGGVAAVAARGPLGGAEAVAAVPGAQGRRCDTETPCDGRDGEAGRRGVRCAGSALGQDHDVLIVGGNRVRGQPKRASTAPGAGGQPRRGGPGVASTGRRPRAAAAVRCPAGSPERERTAQVTALSHHRDGRDGFLREAGIQDRTPAAQYRVQGTARRTWRRSPEHPVASCSFNHLDQPMKRL